MDAEAPHQPLRDDADERARDHIRLRADVHQSRDHRRRVIGVKRREHEMARLGGLHRDLGRLRIADLADENDVGILPQDRPQRAGKRQLDLFVDLRLVDARNLVLDRILDRDDVGLFRFHGAQCGTE